MFLFVFYVLAYIDSRLFLITSLFNLNQISTPAKGGLSVFDWFILKGDEDICGNLPRVH